ncbi:MAG: nuclear transport factor 2 family protein, partial [Arenicella sp.]|nr:nuclear transport factor 2 family protein [Arenicella sp.]
FLFVANLALFSASSVFAKDAELLAGNEVARINLKMDDFHDAADKGDKTRYLNHFAKDGVFMGTDDWERWPYEAFSKYVNKHFKDGKGWSYTPIKRYTNLNNQKTFAWVDEIVESEKWGRFRGTAVLENTEQGWKLKHYSLTVLVPNESWEGVSDLTKKAFGERGVGAGQPPAQAR